MVARQTPSIVSCSCFEGWCNFGVFTPSSFYQPRLLPFVNPRKHLACCKKDVVKTYEIHYAETNNTKNYVRSRRDPACGQPETVRKNKPFACMPLSIDKDPKISR
jgi:hypothetical protein